VTLLGFAVFVKLPILADVVRVLERCDVRNHPPLRPTGDCENKMLSWMSWSENISGFDGASRLTRRSPALPPPWVPIKRGEQIIGAIGVSGAKSAAQDEEVAYAGAAAIQETKAASR